MSAKAGTFEQVRTGTSWTGGWIVAALLAVIVAVSLYAMSRSGGQAAPAGTTARFEVTEQLSGGPSRVATTAGYEVVDQLSGGPSRVVTDAPPAAPAQPGIPVGATICHQCR